MTMIVATVEMTDSPIAQLTSLIRVVIAEGPMALTFDRLRNYLPKALQRYELDHFERVPTPDGYRDAWVLRPAGSVRTDAERHAAANRLADVWGMAAA